LNAEIETTADIINTATAIIRNIIIAVPEFKDFKISKKSSLNHSNFIPYPRGPAITGKHNAIENIEISEAFSYPYLKYIGRNREINPTLSPYPTISELLKLLFNTFAASAGSISPATKQEALKRNAARIISTKIDMYLHKTMSLLSCVR
jgi:hypothetical protein